MAFCLVPKLAEKFKQDIISGKINPDKLSSMTSEERHAFFAAELGESNAAPVNALFESKLLLKNQQAGIISWAKKLTDTPAPVKRDIISRVQRMDRVLNPAEESAFLEDLAAQKLGTRVSYEEAQQIADLSKNVEESKSALGTNNRKQYGYAVQDLKNYLDDLKLQANKFQLRDLITNPGKTVGNAVSNVAGNAKAINASMDNSAIFRQGWKTLWTNPGIWSKNALQTFKDIVQTFGGKDVLREVNADIISRPTYDLMKEAKLAVGLQEEAFPGTIAEKIPIAGRAYKASEAAYTGFVQRTRADVFDKYIQIANKTGVDLTPDELQSIGKLVNSLTGRGNLGAVEPVANVVNNVFFSPRMLKSQFDVLLHPVTGAGGSDFVRRQAALNLLKIISGTATVLATAAALKPGSVEKDPRSADFGKIKIGDTRFDVTGGMSGIITLAARLITMKSKSSTTGKISKINAKDKNGNPAYGATTGQDVVVDFLANKLSPAAQVVRNLLRDQTFSGKKPTLTGEALSLVTPLPVKTFQELQKDPNSANIIISMIAEALGISTNTYSPKNQTKAYQKTLSPMEKINFNVQPQDIYFTGPTKDKSQQHYLFPYRDQLAGPPRIKPLQVQYKDNDSKSNVIDNSLFNTKQNWQWVRDKKTGRYYKRPLTTLQ